MFEKLRPTKSPDFAAKSCKRIRQICNLCNILKNRMKKKFKIIAVTNSSILILGLLIGKYSEVFRGQNPLYMILKMSAWGLLLCSIVWSLINTLFIFGENKEIWRKNIQWIILSLLPIIFFSIILILSATASFMN